MEFVDFLALPEGLRRTAALAAWVQGLYGDEPVFTLVGGAAVELYTGGAYVTGDLDFVGEVPSQVAKRLRVAGFEKRGRHWIHEAAQIFLEFPSRTLDSREEKAVLRVGDLSVMTIRPEDLPGDRLRSLVYWKHKEDGLNAFRLAWTQRRVLNRKRCRDLAQEPEMRAALNRLLTLVPRQGRKATERQVQLWMEEVVP